MTLTNTYKLEDWVRWVLRWLIRPTCILALKNWPHVGQTREGSMRSSRFFLAPAILTSPYLFSNCTTILPFAAVILFAYLSRLHCYNCYIVQCYTALDLIPTQRSYLYNFEYCCTIAHSPIPAAVILCAYPSRLHCNTIRWLLICDAI